MSIELGAKKWDILRNTICGISTSQLVAWRKDTAGKVVVVPFLSHSLLLIFFPIHLTSEDVKEENQSGTLFLESCQSLPQRSHHCREQCVFQAHSALLLKDILI